MSSSLVIEAADSSGRWYLLPGARNSYDLRVANTAEHAVLCKLSLDEPDGAGAVSPSSLTLKAGESRSVCVSFKPDWLTLRDRKAIVSARDAAGTVLATFVHQLVAATTTDCSVSLAWKEEIAGDGMLRGFILTCAIRSISSTPGVFEPGFQPHPALQFPEKQRVTLGPGESSTFDVPVVWNRSARDSEGWNHPRTIEVGVPVTHGRRSATAPWDLVQQHIEPYLTDADRAPVIARRAPPPMFAQPSGAAATPTISPLGLAAPLHETHSARIARAEMEAGVAAGGMRLPAPPPDAAPRSAPARETIVVAPGTLLLIALAIGAIAIVFVWMLRTPVNTAAVSTTPVPVVASPALPTTTPIARHSFAPSRPLQPAMAQIGAPPSRAPAVTSLSTAQRPAGTPTAARGSAPRTARGLSAAAAQRVSPIDRGALVQLNDVGAEYLRGGRQVRVYWASYAQARAQVQVLDNRSIVVAQATVGRRMAALLPLPRGYRGPVYVQVTAIGYDGERVVNSTSLGPP